MKRIFLHNVIAPGAKQGPSNVEFGGRTVAQQIVKRTAVAILFLALTVCSSQAGGEDVDVTLLSVLVQTDAHEGPVVVLEQNRLYFTTVPDFAADDTHIAIRYVDLGTLEVGTFVPRSNMANGMWLTQDGTALLVAEQGTRTTPGGISRIRLADGHRDVLVNSYDGKPFNSPNKVIEASSGWIYFSDPNYGYNQGFKDATALPMAVYAHNPVTGETTRLTTDLARPHGLALSLDETVLYIGDTDAIDGKDPYDPDRSHDVLSAPLIAPNEIGPLQKVLSVPVGIPDGFIVVEPNGELWVAAGDGLRRYADDGSFIELLPIEGGAINVTRHGDYLYATADTEIWQATLPSP